MLEMKTYRLKNSFPDQLNLTERSRRLFNEGVPGQGYIGILDITNGEVHLLPAFNKDDNKSRLNKYNKLFSDYLDSQQPLHTMRSYLHEDAAKHLGLSHLGGQSGKLLGFSVWKDHEENIEEFLNRSTSHNKFVLEHFLLYREFYNDKVFYHSAHLLELHIELPREISQQIYDCLTRDLNLPHEDVRVSKRVNERVRQHFTVEDSYFGDFSSKYFSANPNDHDDKSVWTGFEFLKSLIDGNRLSTLELFIKEAPCILSGRTPETRYIRDPNAVETALTYAIKNKKYKAAKIILEHGASWQDDPAVNNKIIYLLKQQIESNPQGATGAQELLQFIKEKNSLEIKKFFNSPQGKAIITYAEQNNKMNVIEEILSDCEFSCVALIISNLKSEEMILKLTQGTNFLGYSIFSFFVTPAQTIDAKKKEALNNILEQLDTYKLDAIDTLEDQDPSINSLVAYKPH